MRRVICIIKPFKLDAVIEALKKIEISQILIQQVRGFGRQKGHLELYQGTEYSITFLPKVRLEFVVENHQVEETIKILSEAARTGRIGDGKIFIQECM